MKSFDFFNNIFKGLGRAASRHKRLYVLWEKENELLCYSTDV